MVGVFPCLHPSSVTAMFHPPAAGVREPGVVVDRGSTDGVGSSVTEDGSFPVKRELPPPVSITAKIITTMIRII